MKGLKIFGIATLTLIVVGIIGAMIYAYNYVDGVTNCINQITTNI